jgi:hypothetical protein
LLNREQVVEILKLVNEGERFVDVSRRFGVSGTTIADIAYGRKWKDVPGPRLPPPPPRPENRFLGVIYNKRTGKWHASLSLNGKPKYFGQFGHELLAACCVNAHIAWLGLNKQLNVIDPEEWKAAGIYD